MKSITIPDQAIPYAFERRETPIRTKSKETICSYDQLPAALIRPEQRVQKGAQARPLLARDPVVGQIPVREAERRVDAAVGKVFVFLPLIGLVHWRSFFPNKANFD